MGTGSGIERHGSAEPFATSVMHGVWPLCVGYLRGRDPATAEILRLRGQMVEFCEANQLYLARIFHDLDVEPGRIDYSAFGEVLDCAAQPGTRAVVIADLECWREPSRALGLMAERLIVATGVKVHCLVDPRMFTAAGLTPPPSFL
jgi:hypothetical protein